MTDGTPRWERVRAVFAEVIDLPPAAQAARVAELTRGEPWLQAEIESLLAADQAAGDRFELAPPLLADALDPTPELGPEEEVGPYRIVRELGRGGMGAVYEAVHHGADFTKRVAIKTLAGGAHSDQILQRFYSERRILARLEHHNIAALLDGGLTGDGRPFFAME
jgi:serine/threonine-protein kinase